MPIPFELVLFTCACQSHHTIAMRNPILKISLILMLLIKRFEKSLPFRKTIFELPLIVKKSRNINNA